MTLTWSKDLSTAPHDTPKGFVLLAILPKNGHPEAVRWVDYDQDHGDKLGTSGYWAYAEDLINDVTGGVDPELQSDALWAHLEMPHR